MIGRGAAIALFLVSAARAPAIACSATVLFNADAGEAKSHVSIQEGEKLGGLNHLLRDRVTNDVVICNRTRCYPAFALDQDEQPHEILRLEGCKIAETASNEDGLERRTIKNIQIEAKPRRDTFRRHGRHYKSY